MLATRSELVKWINSILCMSIKTITDAANGAIECQIMDYLYPNIIPMSRVNFAAKDSFANSKNYRIIQSAILKLDLTYNIDIDKLSKGRPQDLLEFLQWLKQLYDNSDSHYEYDAVERRSKSKGGNGKEFCPNKHSSEAAFNTSNSSHTSSAYGCASCSEAVDTAQEIPEPSFPQNKTISKNRMDLSNEVNRLKEKLEEKERMLQAVIEERDGIMRKYEDDIKAYEEENQGYYQRLLSIERYLQDKEANKADSSVQDILALLYQPTGSTIAIETVEAIAYAEDSLDG